MKKHLIFLSICYSLFWNAMAFSKTQQPAGEKVEDKFLSFFNAATQAYNQSNYTLAVDYYENILKGGYESVEVYFNLGNAHYKQNNIAQSIYFYEKALLKAPKDEEIKRNLAFAQKMTIDAIPTKTPNGLGQAYGEFIKQYSLDFWSYAAILSLIIALLSYLSYYFLSKTAFKRFCFSLALVALLASIFSYCNGLLIESIENKNRPAIVFETSKALSEPNQQGVLIFELHEGTKVQVLERFNEWAQIKLSDGQTAWVLQKQIKEIKE